MTSMNKVFADLPVTVFEAMSQAARDNNAINLGQGFPDDPGPEDIRRAAADAVMDGYNQYPSMMGIPELRQAIAAHYGRWHGLDLDPMSEVMVTSGGTEALTVGHSRRRRARRRGGLLSAGLRLLSADHPPGRRHSASRAPRAAVLAADRGGAAQAFSTTRPRPFCSTIRSTPPPWSIPAKTSNCWRGSARSSMRSRSATRSGSM